MVNGESLGFTLLASVVVLFIIVQVAVAGVVLIHAWRVYRTLKRPLPKDMFLDSSMLQAIMIHPGTDMVQVCLADIDQLPKRLRKILKTRSFSYQDIQSYLPPDIDACFRSSNMLHSCKETQLKTFFFAGYSFTHPCGVFIDFDKESNVH